MLEAMACGLPTIAHLIPGITDELVQNGKYGFVVDCDDNEAFSSALKVLINNQGLRKIIGQNSHKQIVHNYDLKQIADYYFSLYQTLLLS